MNVNQIVEKQMATSETSRFIYARVAGFTFLFYIAAGLTSMALDDQSPLTDLLSTLMSFSALVLGVMLHKASDVFKFRNDSIKFGGNL